MENWKKTGEKLAYKGYRSIVKKTFILPNGKETDFDIIEGSSYASIVAFTENWEVLLVRQFRAGPEKVMINLPAGYIDPGEEPRNTAKRELLEETGYQADEMVFLKRICNPYSHVDQLCFLALGCKKISDLQLDEDEFLSFFVLPLDEFKDFIQDSEDDSFDGVDASFLALAYLSRKGKLP